MIEKMKAHRIRGLGTTLVEAMIVVVIGTLILLPTIRFIVSSGRSASKGFEKLEALDNARFISERVLRDLKALCSGAAYGFIPISASPTFSFSFPVFPIDSSGKEPPDDENPVNLVRYEYDAAKKTLTRTVKYHPLLTESSQTQTSRILGTNVASFSILPREMLGMRFYEVEVACRSGASSRKDSLVFLRTAVRSEYESRLKRHPFLINNRRSKINFPPP